MADSTARRTYRWLAPLLPLLSLTLAAACERPAVQWTDDAPVASGAPSPLAHPPLTPYDSALADGGELAAFLLQQDLLREAGAHALLATLPDSGRGVLSAPEPTPGRPTPLPAVAALPGTPTMGVGAVPIDPARCARSLRVASAGARGDVAVWWSRRAGTRVHLLSAWRFAGDSAWYGPTIVDSLDQGARDAQATGGRAVGCGRPAPSVAVDDALGFVHVGYALTRPEGAGVFYAHQMDPRAAFEQPPQAIVYGEALGTVRVAAEGNAVAVLYEDPNSPTRSRVALAISRTNGHSFEDRVVASGANADARDPHVLLRGGTVLLGWSEIAPGSEPVWRTRRARLASGTAAAPAVTAH